MSIADQLWAAEELDAIYTEWLINPNYPENAAEEFSTVMELIGKFVRPNNA